MSAQAREDPARERWAREIAVVIETRLLHRFARRGGLAESLLTGLRPNAAALLLWAEEAHVD
ncbi:MAG: hypothetical protein WCD11_35170 [Solirubrobacteraceae bacterium]